MFHSRVAFLGIISFSFLPSSSSASTQTATPSLSVAGGTYQAPQTVAIGDAMSGATIYYTVTGVTPTTESTVYSGPITVNHSMTLKAIAVAPGDTSSVVASASYTIPPAATPTLSLAAGTYQTPQSVTISDTTPGATIYYTVTGVTPTTLSSIYSGPITANRSTALSAIAAVANGPVSSVASAAYTIQPAATPSLSVGTGSYTVFKSVTITDSTPGANIYYTVTGVTPTTMSTLYTGPIDANSNMTLQAIAAVPGGPASPITSATYAFVPAAAPAFSVAAGSYQSPQTVAINDATAGATIYYTVTGVTPTTMSTRYTAPITISNSMTLKAIAVVQGGPSSAVTSAAYSVAPAAAPSFSVGTGTYTVFKSVAISDSTPGTTIYYTVTGVTPTTMSTQYTTPVAVNSNMTLKAIAAFPGGAASPVTTATYTFVPAAAPAFSVAGGSYQAPQAVTISDATPSATIYYTVTGVIPTSSSTKYAGTITVGTNMTLSAIAVVMGGPSSAVTSAAYKIFPATAPVLSEGGGIYQGPQTVTLSDATPGAAIYYTVTGVTPTTFSTRYSGPISVTSNMTLQAIAEVPAGPPSPIAAATYTITPYSTPVKTPNTTASFLDMNVDHLLNGTPWPDLPIGSIRLWDTVTKWGDLNPASTTYQWSNLDSQIAMAQSNGADLLYTFGGVPPWALPTNVPISSISRSGGVVTVTTKSPHGVYFDSTQPSNSQMQITVSSVADSSFNGTFYLTSTPTSSTLTFSQAGTNSTSSSGGISAVCAGAYAPSMCAQAPANLSQWDEFVTQLTAHVGPRVIKYWELWNEANDPIYWQGDPKTLLAMSQDAQSIIKSADPDAIVLSPSVTGNYETAAECNNSLQYCGTTWLGNWMALGGKSLIDAISFHGYPEIGVTPEQVQGSVYQIQIMMNQNGTGSLPIWDTESSWRNNSNVSAAADQAGWLARHLLLEQSIGVQHTFWYAYDTPTWGTLWTSAGGLNMAGEAFTQVSKWITGITITQPCAEIPTASTTFVCSFTRTNGYAAQAVWDTSGTATYTVPSQYIQFHDLTGAVQPIGGGTVQISTSPILLENESVF